MAKAASNRYKQTNNQRGQTMADPYKYLDRKPTKHRYAQHITHLRPPSNMRFEEIAQGGSKVECIDCGLNQDDVWDRDDTGEVWAYEVNNQGVDVWVKARCTREGCGRVEIFDCSGGKASGYAREFGDLDRKHREWHYAWWKENGPQDQIARLQRELSATFEALKHYKKERAKMLKEEFETSEGRQ